MSHEHEIIPELYRVDRDDALELLTELLQHSKDFVIKVRINNEEMHTGLNTRKHRNKGKKYSLLEVRNNSKRLVKYHNEQVAYLDDYMANFFNDRKFRQRIKSLEILHVSPNQIPANLPYLPIYENLTKQIKAQEVEITEKCKKVAKKIRAFNEGKKPTTDELLSIAEQCKKIQASFFNYVVFERNMLLEELKKTFPKDYTSKPSIFVYSHKHLVDEDEQKD